MHPRQIVLHVPGHQPRTLELHGSIDLELDDIGFPIIGLTTPGYSDWLAFEEYFPAGTRFEFL